MGFHLCNIEVTPVRPASYANFEARKVANKTRDFTKKHPRVAKKHPRVAKKHQRVTKEHPRITK